MAGRQFLHAVYESLRRETILALGRTAPNPAVAATVVAETKDGLRLFSGGTEPAGGRHAEIVALDNFDRAPQIQKPGADPDLNFVPESDPKSEVARRMYVTLEPCSHHGRTPPCTDRIQSYPQLKRLVVFTPDPSLKQSGCDILRRSGRRVVLRERHSARAGFSDLLAGFHSRAAGAGPRLHFKLATTADGITGLRERRLLISGPRALEVGQLLRAKLDAVLVGPGTIGIDQPSLALRPDQLAANTATPVTSSRDIFWDSLFTHEAAVRAAIVENPEIYQPARVFILGRPHAQAGEFLRKQVRLGQDTGRPAVYAVLPGCLELWRSLWESQLNPTTPLPAIQELPALDDKVFGPAVRGWLGDLGYNEVLVEGGVGLLSALQSEARAQDRIYLLRSHRVLAEFLRDSDAGQAVAAPGWFSDLPLQAEYDLGGDSLEIRSRRFSESSESPA